jgi:hypothetical protein
MSPRHRSARSATRVAAPARGAWGGARAGAGRPASGPRPSEPHKVRPELSARHPVQITARVVPAVGRLRRRVAYRAIRRAVHVALARADFRIVELCVRATRLELVVEADDKAALARGMQGFQIAAARQLNRIAARRGAVFPDRYRARILATRRAVRRAIRALPGRERTCSPHTWLLRIDARLPPPHPPPAIGERYRTPSARRGSART